MEPLKVSIIEAPCRTLSSPKNMGIWVTKQSMDPIDFHGAHQFVGFLHSSKYLLYVQQNKEIHKGLEQLEAE